MMLLLFRFEHDLNSGSINITPIIVVNPRIDHAALRSALLRSARMSRGMPRGC